jgi:hypothetical protein
MLKRLLTTVPDSFPTKNINLAIYPRLKFEVHAETLKVFMRSDSYCYAMLNKIGICQKIGFKLNSTKFHKLPLSNSKLSTACTDVSVKGDLLGPQQGRACS